MMNPRANAPVMFTRSVPSGKPPPMRSWTNAVNSRRVTPPAALPSATYAISLLITSSRSRSMRPIENHIGALERDQSSGDHCVQLRKDPLDVLVRVDALDHDWQVE